MQERLVEIIVFLLEEFQQTNSPNKYSDISEELVSKGYTESEINLAFSWIFNHLQNKSKVRSEGFTYSEGTTRILHDMEKIVISPEAYGYLLQLKNLALITDEDLEDIIDEALSLGSSSITIDDVKSLAANVLFDADSNNGFMEGLFYHQGKNIIH
ncbi:MAG: DUF494 family protein [Caldithrix sp.]|nr:DUF494 family protein [Caldithrix sp.]